jgi:Myb-like DNA-binding domain
VSSTKSKEQPESHSGTASHPGKPSSTETTGSRRIRRAWTSDEDESLLNGVAKHGFQWTAIHDDPDLDLSHRKATDLRDRIRNKYPEGYKNAETAPPKWQMQKTVSRKNPDANDTATPKGRKLLKDGSGRRKPPSKKPSGAGKSSGLVEGVDGSLELPGRTLPPLDIDDDDWDWSNNTLPPLLDWEEMGILSYQSGQ